MKEAIKTLQSWIDESRSIVFFGGAGVSTESGIPDFRSVDGLYNQQYDYPPEEILSRTFFDRKPEEFYRFYRNKMLCLDAKPNAAHKKLAELEQAGKLKSVVTQNIDGLHQSAGSKRVWELHGSVHRNRCTRCRKPYGLQAILDPFDPTGRGVPTCAVCGGIIKPDVVLYGEGLEDATINGAIEAIAAAGTLLVAGTSLAVYPAASFLSFFSGEHLAVVNLTPTPVDRKAQLAVYADIGEVFEELFRLDAAAKIR